MSDRCHARIAAIATTLLLAPAALGQTATVRVMPAAAQVQPFVPIQIEVVVSWENAVQLAAVEGGCVVWLDQGLASNIQAQGSGWQAQGGSVRNVRIESVPPFFTGGFVVPPFGNSTGLAILRYDLTFEQPGVYPVNWVPSPDMPLVRLFTNVTSPVFVDAPTTYIGTQFIVGNHPGLCRPDLTTTAVPGSPGYHVPNGVVNNEDFFYYLAQFAAGNALRCDLTHTAVPGSPAYGIPNFVLNNDDFFYYLAIFSQGC